MEDEESESEEQSTESEHRPLSKEQKMKKRSRNLESTEESDESEGRVDKSNFWGKCFGCTSLVKNNYRYWIPLDTFIPCKSRGPLGTSSFRKISF